MELPVTALLAAAIHEARFAVEDPAGMDLILSLLTRATGGAAVSLEVSDEEFLVNATRIPSVAPGASLVRDALGNHDTVRLRVPPGALVEQWRSIVTLYASAPGLYESIDDLRDALRATVPDVMVSNTRGRAAEADLRAALFELPGLRATEPGREPARTAKPHDEEIARLNGKLDPLLASATGARASHDYEALASVLGQLRAIEESEEVDLRAIVARERRRTVPLEELEQMARAISKPGAPAIIARTLGNLGNDGAAALLNALNGAPSVHERRAYIDALVACRDCDDAIVEALSNSRLELARDAAEVAGRRRIDRAVPALTHMLRHTRADIRTAAWHALELIGTPAAMKAFRT